MAASLQYTLSCDSECQRRRSQEACQPKQRPGRASGATIGHQPSELFTGMLAAAIGAMLPPRPRRLVYGPRVWCRSLAIYRFACGILMLRKLVTIATWAVLCFIAYATLSPITARPTFPISPSIEHIAAFAVLGVFCCLAYPRHTVLVCTIVFGAAILLEVAQLMTPDRHGRIQDAIEKIAGGAAGILAARTILRLERVSRWFQN
jgi:VanZ family protein